MADQTPQPGYRPATPADADAIAALIAEVVAEPDPVGIDRALSPEDVVAWLERLGASGALYVADAAGELAGFGALDFNTQEPDTASLGVWLRASQRRRGIGTVLAEYLLDHARRHGFKRVVGRLPDDNEPALSFLSNIGALAPLINPDMRFELPL